MTNKKIKTATRICNAAKDLFNEHGIASVSIRQIAMAMGMSTGNLTYHFKHREDIVERLYFEMVEVFDQPINNLKTLEFSIVKLFETSFENYKRMVDYKFIWVDLHQTLRESEKIKHHFLETRAKRTMAYGFMIKRFIEGDLMHPPQYKLEYDLLVKRLVESIDFWISSQTLNTSVITGAMVVESHQAFIGIFHPYLTSKGLKEWKQCIQQK